MVGDTAVLSVSVNSRDSGLRQLYFQRCVRGRARGEILRFDLPRHSHYSGVIPMVFQHSGGRDFDLVPRHSHYSAGVTQGLSLWCFNIVGGGEILTFPDTLTTQGLSLWCFNIVRAARGRPSGVRARVGWARARATPLRSGRSETKSIRSAVGLAYPGRDGPSTSPELGPAETVVSTETAARARGRERRGRVEPRRNHLRATSRARRERHTRRPTDSED